jgi:hypothetical protein
MEAAGRNRAFGRGDARPRDRRGMFPLLAHFEINKSISDKKIKDTVGALDNCIYQIHFLTKLSWRLHHIYQRFVHRGKNLSRRFLTKGMKSKKYFDFKSTHIDSFLNYFVKKNWLWLKIQI